MELKTNFNKDAKLEIQVKGKYYKTSPNVFRSWHGNRRIDGKPFRGERFYFNSNDIYREDKKRTVKVVDPQLTPQELGPIRITIITPSTKGAGRLPLVKTGRVLTIGK